jgi:hypothetical protein
MLYLSRLINSLVFICLAALIIMQRDVDGGLLITGWHGLGPATLIAFTAAILNFRGALSAAFFDMDR